MYFCGVSRLFLGCSLYVFGCISDTVLGCFCCLVGCVGVEWCLVIKTWFFLLNCFPVVRGWWWWGGQGGETNATEAKHKQNNSVTRVGAGGAERLTQPRTTPTPFPNTQTSPPKPHIDLRRWRSIDANRCEDLAGTTGNSSCRHNNQWNDTIQITRNT